MTGEDATRRDIIAALDHYIYQERVMAAWVIENRRLSSMVWSPIPTSMIDARDRARANVIALIDAAIATTTEG